MWMWKVAMYNYFFVSLIIMLVCDPIGLHLLRKNSAKMTESLDKLRFYWTDANNMAYLIGYVGMFRFLQINNAKITIILSVQAIAFWTCIFSLFFIFYERLFL